MTAEALNRMSHSATPALQAATQNASWTRGLAPRPRHHARLPALRELEAAGRCALTRPRAGAAAAADEKAGDAVPADARAAGAIAADSAAADAAATDAAAAAGAPAKPAQASPPWPRLHWPRILIRPYAPADLDALVLQPGQAHVQAQLGGRGYAQALAQTEAYTVLLQEAQEGGARVIACLGAYALHPGRALVWGLLSRDCGPHLLSLTRAVRRWLASCPYARVEAHAEHGFAAGARWLRLLGFACETPQGMRRFTPEGRASSLYAWLREEALAGPCPASACASTSAPEPISDAARPA